MTARFLIAVALRGSQLDGVLDRDPPPFLDYRLAELCSRSAGPPGRDDGRSCAPRVRAPCRPRSPAPDRRATDPTDLWLRGRPSKSPAAPDARTHLISIRRGHATSTTWPGGGTSAQVRRGSTRAVVRQSRIAMPRGAARTVTEPRTRRVRRSGVGYFRTRKQSLLARLRTRMARRLSRAACRPNAWRARAGRTVTIHRAVPSRARQPLYDRAHAGARAARGGAARPGGRSLRSRHGPTSPTCQYLRRQGPSAAGAVICYDFMITFSSRRSRPGRRVSERAYADVVLAWCAPSAAYGAPMSGRRRSCCSARCRVRALCAPVVRPETLSRSPAAGGVGR
jgi:hypothetical protein